MKISPMPTHNMLKCNFLVTTKFIIYGVLFSLSRYLTKVWEFLALLVFFFLFFSFVPYHLSTTGSLPNHFKQTIPTVLANTYELLWLNRITRNSDFFFLQRLVCLVCITYFCIKIVNILMFSNCHALHLFTNGKHAFEKRMENSNW